MEEDIKILESLIEEYENVCKEYQFYDVPVHIDENDIQAIKHLIKIVDSLDITVATLRDELKNTVSKDKIRKKIESLEDKVHILRPDATKGEMMREFKIEGAINILYDLLEEN